ncbi:hypothetical protein BDE02_11G032100 [Populus trichocarpa]|nr:hypothetical protein BDE02_11G032100 [Populus trichocarpa]
MLLFQLEAQMPYCHVILLPNISKVFIVYKGLRMSSHGICSYTCRNSTVSHEYVDFMMNLSTSTICKFFMGVLIGLWQGDKIQNLGKGSWAEGNGDTWVDYVITQSANVSVGSEHGW